MGPPSDAQPGFGDNNFGFYGPDPTAWSIASVEHPEGGVVSYAFEPDEYHWYQNFDPDSPIYDTNPFGGRVTWSQSSIEGGDVRLVSVQADPGTGDPALEWTYEYGEGVKFTPDITSHSGFHSLKTMHQSRGKGGT